MHSRPLGFCRVTGRQRPRPKTDASAGGTVYVLALLLLVIFATLSLSLAAITDLNLRKSDNQRGAQAAQLTAESGLAFMTERLQHIRLPGGTSSETFPANLAAALGEMLDGTANLAGATVTSDGSTVSVPAIELLDRAFSGCFAMVAADRCRMTMSGSTDDIQRRVAIDLLLEAKRARAFDYGLASRGQIKMSGNARILGVTDPAHASILSATELYDEAIILSDNATVDGDVYTAGDDTYVTITDTPSVGGSTDPEGMAEHIHEGIDPPDFPEIDVSGIIPLAINVFDAASSTGLPSYSNIRIVSGTNPTFASDVILNGVVYIEAPNIVKFSGQATINGLVVTQDSDQPIDSCQLRFTGGVQANGVDSLPDTSEFAAIKQYTGTLLVAPGFGATFAGNFGTVNGMIAADQLTFTGTAQGVVNGTVLGLADLPTNLGGNVEIRVNPQGSVGDSPAGFVKSIALVPQSDSYLELTGD